jgi:hypothetical protein
MADTGTTQDYQVIVGGKGREYTSCTACDEAHPGLASTLKYVYHVGYTEGRVGGDVWMCEECVMKGEHTAHYDRTGYTPEFVAKTKSTQAEEKPVKNAKKGTTSKPKSTKPVDAVVETPTSPIEGTFVRNKELDSGKVRFGVTDKGSSVQGSIYIPGDLIPEGCTDIIVTIVCKEN